MKFDLSKAIPKKIKKEKQINFRIGRETEVDLLFLKSCYPGKTTGEIIRAAIAIAARSESKNKP